MSLIEEESKMTVAANSSPSDVSRAAPEDPPDSCLVSIVTSLWWNTFFLWMIFANTVTMAMYRPTEPDDSDHNNVLAQVEVVFLVIFTIEVGLKLIAFGMSKFFEDGWNIMDLIIVATGYLIFADEVNTSVFRTIRVLRPLRSIGMMPGIRVLIDALIVSLPGLASTLMLIMFVFTILGVVGVQLFSGSYSAHCVPAMHCAPNVTGVAVDYMQYGACETSTGCAGSIGNDTLVCVPVEAPLKVPVSLVFTGEVNFCRLQHNYVTHLDEVDATYGCASDYTCQFVAVPFHHDATHWDDISGAWIILFQLCTTEGWTGIMDPMLDTNSGFAVYIYFLFALMFTSMFLVNFVVAQMVVAFERASGAQNHKPPEKTAFAMIFKFFQETCGSKLLDDVWVMRAAFNRADVDGSGYLDANEVFDLSEILEMEVPFEEIDSSGDGQVPYKEFERWWWMRRAYDRADADGSKELDVAEAKTLAETLGVNFDFDEMDLNGNGSVDYSEFRAWWDLRSRFDLLDVSGDGSLNGNEMGDLSEQLGLPQDFVDLFVEKGDTNEDGAYNFEEFAMWWQLYHVFTRMDQDNSNSLDEVEMAELSKSMDVEVSVADVSDRGEVSFEELLGWWANKGRAAKSALLMAKKDANPVEGPITLRNIVNGAIFSNTVMVVVIMNFFVLAYDHHNINSSALNFIEILNLAFTIFFALELVVKMVALGPGDYFSDRFNTLDFFIVAISVIELLQNDAGAMSAMRTLRLLRVMRSLRIFSTVPAMRRLIAATMKSGQAIIDFGILLFCFMIIYSLIGMHVFGANLSSPMYTCPGRFDSFYYAFLTVFQVLTRENWHELLYVSSNEYGLWAFMYYASLIVLANYMILSLFLGNMLHNLHHVFLAEAKSLTRKAASQTKRVPGQRFVKDKLTTDEQSLARSILSFQNVKITADMPLADKEKAAALIIQRAWFRRIGLLDFDGKAKNVEKSLGIFAEDSGLRSFAVDLVTNTIFDWCMLSIIVASSVALAFEKPGDAQNSTGEFHAADLAVAIIFTLEMIVVVIAYGFTGAETAYFNVGWNILDFFIVIFSWLCLIPSSQEYRILRVMRMFRVIRVLRGLRWMPGLGHITGAMVQGMVPIAVVGAIAMFAASIFAVALTSMLKGKMHLCDQGNDSFTHTYLTYAECSSMGYNWVNSDQNFDNYFNSLLTMFELTTMEDWQAVMYGAMDTTDILTTAGGDNTYERGYRGNPPVALMFLGFILVGSFFFLNLFLGVVTNAMEMVNLGKEASDARDQARADDHMYMVLSVGPVSTVGAYFMSIKRPCMSAVQSRLWELAVAAGIIINTAAMACEHRNQGKWMDDLQGTLNTFFTFFFTVELVVKVIAMGGRRCFRDKWNLLDLLIVVMSWAEVVLQAAGDDVIPVDPTVFRTFRVFRLTRLLKLVPHSEGLQLIFRTFLDATPMLATVGMLLAIVLFIYTILSVQLFGNVGYSDGEMNDIMNFNNFENSMFTLCVMSTGEHWNAVMHELKSSADGPGTMWVVLLFVSFQFMCVFLVLNLFVSVVVVAVQLEEKAHYNDKLKREAAGMPTEDRDIDWNHVDGFVRKWMKVDHAGTGFFTKKEQVVELIHSLTTGHLSASALARGFYGDERDSAQVIAELGESPYKFTDVLYNLTVRAFELPPVAAAKALRTGGYNKASRQAASFGGNVTLEHKPADSDTKFVNPMHGQDGGEEQDDTE